MVSFLTTYWFVNCLAATTYLCWLCYSSLLDKKDYFVCLFTVAFLSTIMWVFSLAIPHGMHLVVPTHLSFFWVVCHPSKTSPVKESEREPQSKLSLLPTTRPYPLLPLTHVGMATGRVFAYLDPTRGPRPTTRTRPDY